jgi:hypothetical protein
MMTGQCDTGKKMVRTALTATMSQMSPEMIDNVVETDGGNFCQGSSMSPRDQAIKAANDLQKAYSQTVDVATCKSAYETLKKILPTLKPQGDPDYNYNSAVRGPLSAPTCFASAGDCASAWKAYQEQNKDAKRPIFEATVPKCKGK